MTRAGTYEDSRLQIQAALDEAKTPQERNRLGQVATPTELADEILGYADRLLRPVDQIRFLDPAFGTGSFYSALRRAFAADRIRSACGVEIDPHYGGPAHDLWQDTELDLRIGDFTRLHAPTSAGDRFNLVICNPPYVRHHHIPPTDKARLPQLAEDASGVRIGGLAGFYCYFLALAHAWMADGGLAGWLIPSEFMDVGYGASVKRYLLGQVTLLHVHRYDPAMVQFRDALVSSAVVWFRNQRPPEDHQVRFTYGGTLSAPMHERLVEASVLQSEPKWTRHPLRERASVESPSLTVGDLFAVRRGLVTGANSFFILTREQISERGLPMDCFLPVLPSPRYLDVETVPAAGDGTPAIVRQLFLLKCDLPEEVVKVRYPTLWDYLQEGRAQGVPDGYLCKHRSPWYSQEDRPPPLLLCTYMGRASGSNGKPFRFILNRSQATATNVYLLMYPRDRLVPLLAADRSLASSLWNALNGIVASVLTSNGRVYGGGLHKLEPRELMGVPVDGLGELLPPDWSPARQLGIPGL